jgi:cell division protein FtsQ
VSIVSALVILLAVAVYSPLLALRTIAIEGNHKLSTEEVLSAVDGQLGTPLALVDLGKVRTELGRFTLIRSYVTEIVPPSTLVIHLVERQAIGSIARGGMFDQVDPAGVVLGTSADTAGLPVISVGPSGSSSSAFRPAVDVLLAIPASVLRHVQSVSATTADDVSLILSGSSTSVVWGSAAQSTLKARVLTAMLARPECRSQAVIDVSAPLAPICGPK